MFDREHPGDLTRHVPRLIGQPDHRNADIDGEIEQTCHGCRVGIERGVEHGEHTWPAQTLPTLFVGASELGDLDEACDEVVDPPTVVDEVEAGDRRHHTAQVRQPLHPVQLPAG